MAPRTNAISRNPTATGAPGAARSSQNEEQSDGQNRSQYDVPQHVRHVEDGGRGERRYVAGVYQQQEKQYGYPALKTIVLHSLTDHPVYGYSRDGDNSRKPLWTGGSACPTWVLSFGALIFSGIHVPEILHLAAGPFDYHTVRPVAPGQPEGHRQFRLRQVTRPGLHHARLRPVGRRDPNHRANAIAIRFCPLQTKAQGSITRCQIVAIKVGWPLIGGEQKVEVPVSVEIAHRQAPADFGRREASAQLRRDIAEPAFSVIQK
jgi:hypothetical protein